MKKNQFYRDMLDASTKIYEREINNTVQSKYYLSKHLSELMSHMEQIFEIPLLKSDFEVWAKDNKKVADLYIKVSNARDFSDYPDYKDCDDCDCHDSDTHSCTAPNDDKDYFCSLNAKPSTGDTLTLMVSRDERTMLGNAVNHYIDFCNMMCDIEPCNFEWDHHLSLSNILYFYLVAMSQPIDD